MKTPFLGAFLLAALCTSAAVGQQSKWDKHSPPKQQTIGCQTCHECAAPTKTDPCLSPCPRARISSGFHPPKSGPEVIVMSKVSKQYGPVVFSHRLHAEMSEMSGGCYGCHHYNSTSMTILSCKECHPPVRARSDLSMPDLKGAYHRQCMDCHRQWSKSTECTGCHLKRGPDQTAEEALKAARLKGRSHPEVPLPQRVVYETRSQLRTFVTFFHNDHAERFGLKCSDCHKQEGCVRCHDRSQVAAQGTAVADRAAKPQRSMEALHAPCFSCHQTDKCEECHVAQPMEAFDHARSAGWPLNRFHEKLSCQKCHGQKARFTKVGRECGNCHSGWAPGTFKHEITGLRLDAAHAELDCETCHADRNFEAAPTCDGCHDDKAYPRDKPGTVVRRTAR